MHCLYLGTFITVMARRRPRGEWSQLSASSNLKYSIKAEEGSHWAGLGWAGLGAGLGWVWRLDRGRPNISNGGRKMNFNVANLELHCSSLEHGYSRSSQSRSRSK